MVLPNISGALSLLYEDRMTIKRMVAPAPDDLFSDEVETTILSDHPCRLSSKATNRTGSLSQTSNNADFDMILICAPDVDLIFGDEVTVNQGGRIQRLRIGVPKQYKGSLQTQCRVITSA